MSYSDKEILSLYNTPVTELEIVDINNLVPNTLYLYEHNDGDDEDDVEKAVVEFINIIGTNRNYVVGKTLTDRHGNITDNVFMVDQNERDHYKFYKKRLHPTGLHEEIKQGADLKSGLHPKGNIKSLSKLAYDQLSLHQKDEYNKLGVPPIIGGLHLRSFKMPPSGAVMSDEDDADCAFSTRKGVKRKRTTKRNRKRKRSRSLRGKTKTKTKTRKQK